MLPFYFHVGSGRKSALWGLKHWPWRAALATKTDGNPPANPSSSQPIITSLWPRALLPKAPPPLPNYLPVLLLPLLSLRERWCFPYYHFKHFPQSQTTWPHISVVAGGAVLSDSKCLWKLRQWETKRYFAVIQPNTSTYSWPDFKVAAGSGEARPNRHGLTTLQRRPVKTHIHGFTARNSFNDLLFPWFNTLLLQHSVFYSGLCWIRKKQYCWVWMQC